jgi:hypothetical protein
MKRNEKLDRYNEQCHDEMIFDIAMIVMAFCVGYVLMWVCVWSV